MNFSLSPIHHGHLHPCFTSSCSFKSHYTGLKTSVNIIKHSNYSDGHGLVKDSVLPVQTGIFANQRNGDKLGINSTKSHEQIASLEDMNSFVLDPDLIRSLLVSDDDDIDNVLIRLVQPLTELARPSISNFKVCAIGLGGSGKAYVGVNLEFPGLPLHHSVHAEQFMVANAAQHGESKLKCVVVSQPPCGHCRQFLQELRGAGGIKVYIVKEKLVPNGLNSKGNPRLNDQISLNKKNVTCDIQFHLLEYFLPYRFGPHDLLEEDFPLLLESRHNGLAFPINTRFSSESHKTLAEEALLVANDSYSPYTKSPSAISLLTKSGQVFCGSYMESAAYNPGLPPLQAAIVALVSNGGMYTDITEAVLVEKEDAAIQFYETTKIALAKISPSAKLKMYLVT